MTMTGRGGEVRVGAYQRAAGIGEWTLTSDPSDPSMGRVEITVVDPDPFWACQGPDTLRLRLGSQMLTFTDCRSVTETTWDVRGGPVAESLPEAVEVDAWQMS